jgi:hypothetical protein
MSGCALVVSILPLSPVLILELFRHCGILVFFHVITLFTWYSVFHPYCLSTRTVICVVSIVYVVLSLHVFLLNLTPIVSGKKNVP